MDMSAKVVRVGVMACAALLFGAAARLTKASDTPPVLEQTATIEKSVPLISPPPERRTPKAGKKREFKVKLKVFRRYLRFFDLKGEPFNELRKPSLFLINGEYAPWLDASVEKDRPCGSSSPRCSGAKPFPYAFGIGKLKNEGGKRSSHAFLYIPYRSGNIDNAGNQSPYLGDRFWLLISHIPEAESDCNQLTSDILREHCHIIFKLSLLIGKRSEGHFAIEVQEAYRDWLVRFVSEGSFDDVVRRLEPDGSRKELILSHNEIIHGSLK